MFVDIFSTFGVLMFIVVVFWVAGFLWIATVGPYSFGGRPWITKGGVWGLSFCEEVLPCSFVVQGVAALIAGITVDFLL